MAATAEDLSDGCNSRGVMAATAEDLHSGLQQKRTLRTAMYMAHVLGLLEDADGEVWHLAAAVAHHEASPAGAAVSAQW